MKQKKDGIYCRHIKRILDVICSSMAIIVLSPVFIVAAILIRFKLGAPVLFRQERIGKDEKPFVMYKFRSMSNAKDSNGELLPDAQRIGSFGRFLRSSSVDELPALFNILKGDMSIIGPRPLPTLYQPYFYESERKRHSIRGGLSGLAQVNGRNALSWEQKFAYDCAYVDTVSFVLDVKIVLITIKKVFKRSDIGLRGVTGPEDFNVYRSKKTEGYEMNIYGEKVMLRAMELEDMEMLRDTVNDPETENLVGGWSFPVSSFEQRKWFEQASQSKDGLRLIIEDLQTKTAIGMVNLVNIDWKNRVAFTGMKLHSSVPRGQGYATDTIMAIMSYAFEQLQLERLDGAWLLYNIPSKRAYEKCGWKEEGIKRRAIYKNGQYFEQAYAGVLREDYYKAKERLGWSGRTK